MAAPGRDMLIPLGQILQRHIEDPGTVRKIMRMAATATDTIDFIKGAMKMGREAANVANDVQHWIQQTESTWTEFRMQVANQVATWASETSGLAQARRNVDAAQRHIDMENRQATRAGTVATDNHGLPDIGLDTMPSNGGRNPTNSGGTPVRDVGIGGRARTNRNTPMDASGTVEPVPEAAAARSSGGGGGPSAVSKETPISNYPSLSYGLQETHTTILPWNGWCSMAIAEFANLTPVQMKIRMNTVWDMFNTTLAASPAINTAPTANGLYGVPFDNDGKRPNQSLALFPETMTAGPNANERPAWRDYWSALYEYYTVLGCEYKITMINPSTQRGQNIIVGTEFDSYSGTATSTGNVMPPTYLADALAFKGMQWQILETNSPEYNKNVGVISGKYKPGQTRRNIVNDGDVKTWTATGATLPTLKEDLVVNFWRAPLSFYDGGTTGGTAARPWVLNMQIELKYIVQFKDLKQQARYPNRLDPGQDITQILNEDATAAGTAHQKWG